MCREIVWRETAPRRLSGTIPAQLGNLTNLQDLNLGSNRLSGTIPAELGNVTHLESLMLLSNQLSGPIPTRLGNLTSLTFLALSSNQLSGSIPAELGSLPKLIRDLTISYNALYTNDSSLMNSLNAKSPGWRNTQTVAPVGLAARTQSASSIAVSWTSIAYSSDPGRYIVLQSTVRGGPYSPAGSTADKRYLPSRSQDSDLLRHTILWFRLLLTRTRTIGIRLQVSTVLRCPRQPTNPVPNDQQPRPFGRNGRCSGSYARGQRQKLRQGVEGAVEWVCQKHGLRERHPAHGVNLGSRHCDGGHGNCDRRQSLTGRRPVELP